MYLVERLPHCELRPTNEIQPAGRSANGAIPALKEHANPLRRENHKESPPRQAGSRPKKKKNFTKGALLEKKYALAEHFLYLFSLSDIHKTFLGTNNLNLKQE